MDSKRAREIAVREAEKIRAELPVCYGCPEGRFEESVDRWLKKLSNMMRQATFLEWRYATVGAPAVMFVLQAEQPGDREHPILEVPIARVDGALGPQRQLAIIGNEADEIEEQRPAAERDRIGEILENQQTILAGLQAAHEKIDHLQRMIVTRDGGARELMQRVLMLVNHWGRSPYVGTVDTLLGKREVVLERPLPPETPATEPAK